MTNEIKPDEGAADKGARAHHTRRQSYIHAQHEVFDIDDYTAPVIAALKACFTILFSEHSRASLAVNRRKNSNHFGFKAEVIKEAAQDIQWEDHELVHSLKYGFYDYSADTPPISWFDPPSASIYKQWATFQNNVQSEIDKGWIAGPSQGVPMIPFRIVPVSVIPKPRRPDKFTVICNASLPGFPDPKRRSRLGRGQISSIYELGSGATHAHGLLVATHSASWRMDCDFSHSRKDLGVRIAWTNAGICLLVPHADNSDIRVVKKCVLFFSGNFYVDTRAQMGCVASAHSGQRLSFLIVALAGLAALERF